MNLFTKLIIFAMVANLLFACSNIHVMATTTPNAYKGIQTGISNLGLTLNTPANNQQSAQKAGTYNTAQAGSNQQPYNAYGAIQAGFQNGGLTYNTGPKPTATNTATDKVAAPTSGGTPSAPSSPTSYTDPEGNNWANQDAFNSAIDGAYGSSYDYLGKVEGSLRDQLPGTIDAANQNFDLNSKMLNDQNTSNMNQFGLQLDQSGQAKETQSAQIRRLYNELGQGYHQRFGGSTSAGQAASEIANVEQQRQTGQLSQHYNDTVRQIQAQQQDVETKHQNGLMQLQQQKQQAVSQAQQDFQNKLLDIAGKRAELDSNKAQMRLSALMDLRNKVFAIEQQNIQFQQALEAQKQASQLSLGNYANQATGGVNAGQGATSGFQQTPQATSNLQTNKQPMSTTNQPLTGAISQNNNQDWMKSLGLS